MGDSLHSRWSCRSYHLRITQTLSALPCSFSHFLIAIVNMLLSISLSLRCNGRARMRVRRDFRMNGECRYLVCVQTRVHMQVQSSLYPKAG
jgi:hypothetical protein